MRVTTFGINSQFLNDLGSIMSKYQGLQAELDSGRKLNQPSDDPVGFTADIQLQSSLNEVNEWSSNASAATTSMQSQDSTLGDIQSVLGNIRTQLLQALNGTNTPGDLQNTGRAVYQEVSNAIQLANTSDGQQYIFAGLTGKQQPISMSSTNSVITSIKWSGGGTQTVTIGNGITVPSNVDGVDIFNTAPSGTGNSLLATLQNINNHLNSGGTNVAAIQAQLQSDLNDLNGNIDNVSAQRAKLGGQMDRAEAATNQMNQLQNTLKQQKSNVEDANMADVISQLTTQQTVYEAALQTGSHLILPTLADTLK